MADRLTRTLVVGGLLSSSGSSKAPLFRENGNASEVPARSGGRASTKRHFLVAVSYRGRHEAVGRDARPRRAYIKSVASVHKTWRERGEFRLDQLFHGRASALRALGILLSMSSNVTWSTSWYSVLPSTESGPACAACCSP